MENLKVTPQYLQADCANCFALCCVALPYAKSSDFAFNKTSGEPCRNLDKNFLCRIHKDLREKGFKGCTVYECFGAGQKVSQHIYKGKSWRDSPNISKEMFEVFPIVQQLHEILYYLNEAGNRSETQSIHKQLSSEFEKIDNLTKINPKEILSLDINEIRAGINPLLINASEQVRKKYKRNGRMNLPRELFGASLQNQNLSGYSFRGSILIGANLSNSNLRGAEFIGADLRGTNLCGADMQESIFLTQSQLNASKGNKETKLPPHLQLPHHWG
ncbi:Pentapeptide repeat-containing protein [Gracilibacillus ureilyticus]|uniref:Pentapeptide repeat-containing protein n=1 Tax=Gracilibacillus ureilyticus TaxID=531814 RepID=A0A1H9UTB1_9BACI|nr:pentapeptide repeat-containing protein [Gracilibacillus ureilyticus]SES12760.1 Pentapeptide repeat-containing protein [Gracilibacillus ureilyticus]